MLADELRLERAVAVAGRGDGHLAQVAGDRLFRPAVAAVGRTPGAVGRRLRHSLRLGRVPFTTEVDVHLRVEHPLHGRLHHQPQQAIEVFGRLGLASHLPGQLLGPRLQRSIHASVSCLRKQNGAL